MKYIMTSRGPIIFPDNFNHSDFKNIGPNIELESAGTLTAWLDPSQGVQCITNGESFTLGLRSRESDGGDIARMLQHFLD